VGQAFLFDGVNDYVFTPLDVQPSAIPETTWEAWVYPQRANYSYRQTLFSNDDGGYDRTVLIEANTSNFGVFTGAWVWQPTVLDLNQWQHIAVVYSTDNILFYKNGQQFSYGVAPVGQSSNWSFYIGRNPGYGEYFQGLIDEVSIYDRALDAGEILTIYYADSYGKCKDAQTPTEASISGRLVDYNGQDPIADARINLTGDMTNEKTTDNQGQYVFSELPTGASYTVTPNYSGMFFQPAIRQYGSLTGDQITQDFTGSLYGDVSGDGTIKSFDTSLILRYIVGAITSFPVEGSSTGKGVSPNGRLQIGTVVRIEGGPLVAGTRTTISVSIENEDELYSSDLTFSFNPSVLRLVRISPGEIADGFLAAHSASGNEIRIGLAGAHPIQSSGRLLNLEFDVLPPSGAVDDGSPLILEEAVFNEGLHPEKVLNATFDSPTLPTRLMLGQNYPNPFNPVTTIGYAIPSQEGSQTVLLEIFNLNGETINMLVNQKQPAGHYRVQWDGKTHFGETVPSGIYFYSLKVGSHIRVRKMMFLK